MKDPSFDAMVSILEEVYEKLLLRLPEELRSLPYETIVLSEEERQLKKGVRKYYVLRGYYHRNGKKKSKVLACYRGDINMQKVNSLIYLYRLVKYLDEALSYGQALKGRVKI